jgi:hypothetical protein
MATLSAGSQTRQHFHRPLINEARKAPRPECSSHLSPFLSTATRSKAVADGWHATTVDAIIVASLPAVPLTQRKAMKVRIASDVGGTFTDSIVYDPVSRRIAVSKVPTTPQAREVGTIDSLRRALHELGMTGSAVAYVGHGTTTATNAVIQRTGAKTAFVTNRGFRDLLLIGRQEGPVCSISMSCERPRWCRASFATALADVWMRAGARSSRSPRTI